MPNNTNITHLPTDETLAAGLADIADALGATVDSAMSDTSTNAVQNKVIKEYVDAQSGGGATVINGTIEGTTITSEMTYQQIINAFLQGAVNVFASVENYTYVFNLIATDNEEGACTLLFYNTDGEKLIATGNANDLFSLCVIPQ